MWLNGICRHFEVGYILRSQQNCEISNRAPPHQPHTPCCKVNWRRRAWPLNLLHRHHRPGDCRLNVNPVRNLPSVCGHLLSRSDWQSRWTQPAGKNPEHNRNNHHQQLQPSWCQINEAKHTEKHKLTALSKSMLVIPALLPIRAPLGSQRPARGIEAINRRKGKMWLPWWKSFKEWCYSFVPARQNEKQDRKPWPPVWSAHQQWLPTTSLCGPCRQLLRDENQGWTSLHSPHHHAPPVDTGHRLVAVTSNQSEGHSHHSKCCVQTTNTTHWAVLNAAAVWC